MNLKKLLESGRLDLSKVSSEAKEQIEDLKAITNNFENFETEDREIEAELLDYIKLTTPDAISAKEGKAKSPKSKPTKPKPVAPVEKKSPTKKTLNEADCGPELAKLRTLIAEYKQGKEAKKRTVKRIVKKKTLANAVVDSVVNTINRVVVREKKATKNIKPEKFDQVIKTGKEFLKAIRSASGGISKNNDQVLNRFESDVQKIIDKLKGV